MIVPKLRIRITHIDATVVNTVDPVLDDTSLPRVPVIRIFGQLDTTGLSSTSDLDADSNTNLDANACLHVHQVYPYVYIDYDGSREPSAGEPPLSSNSASCEFLSDYNLDHRIKSSRLHPQPTERTQRRTLRSSSRLVQQPPCC